MGTFTNLGANPTREDLRNAATLLRGLAACDIAGAQDELDAVNALMRVKYPRIPDQSTPRRRRAKRRKLIIGADCRATCTVCDGTGYTDQGHRLTCTNCAGGGIVDGIAEHDPADTCLEGRTLRGEKPIRGEFAQQDGLSDHRPMGSAGHTRGFAPGTGVIHTDSPECRAVLQEWRDARMPIEQIELASALEGAAIDSLGEYEIPEEAHKPRGRRLNGSRRDKKGLTPRQQRRSLMADRVQKRQAEHNRSVRREKGWVHRGPSSRALDEALRLIGIDPAEWREAIKANLPETTIDDRLIYEARRRGDLPPDDMVPQWNDDNAVTLADGRRVVVQGRLRTTAWVFRMSSGSVEKVYGGIQCRTQDGDLDIVHPEEVPMEVQQ